MSIGSYLRALRSAHASAETLVVQLEAFVKTLDVSPAAATILIQAIKQCAEDLFVPYLDGQRYLDKEVFFLSENLSNAVRRLGCCRKVESFADYLYISRCKAPPLPQRQTEGSAGSRKLSKA